MRNQFTAETPSSQRKSSLGFSYTPAAIAIEIGVGCKKQRSGFLGVLCVSAVNLI